MKTNIKRFRVFDTERQAGIGRFDTTMEAYEFLKNRTDLENLFIDCVVDDIEVTAEEFVQTFNDGETFEDLQGF